MDSLVTSAEFTASSMSLVVNALKRSSVDLRCVSAPRFPTLVSGRVLHFENSRLERIFSLVIHLVSPCKYRPAGIRTLKVLF